MPAPKHPNPFPYTLVSHNPLLLLHTPLPDTLPRHSSPSHAGPRSPSRTIPAPTRTSHPTLPHQRSPTRSGRSPRSTSSHTRTLPTSSPSLPSRLPESFPQPPLALLHTPKPPQPVTAGSPPPAPRPGPGMWGRHPLDRPSCLPQARSSRVDGSLRRRGV